MIHLENASIVLIIGYRTICSFTGSFFFGLIGNREAWHNNFRATQILISLVLFRFSFLSLFSFSFSFFLNEINRNSRALSLFILQDNIQLFCEQLEHLLVD